MEPLAALPPDAPRHIVATPDDVATAFAGGGPVVLVSQPGAAAFQGVGWLRQVAEDIAPPGARWSMVLDVADAPGLALEALEDGVPAVIVRGLPAATVGRLRAFAAAMSAVVLEDGCFLEDG